MAREAHPEQRIVRWGAAVLLILLLLASAAALSSGHDDQASRALVGDLKLADQDEGPADGVQATFVASNLAPGDTVTGRLGLSQAGAVLDQAPREVQGRVDDRAIRVAFQVTGGSTQSVIAQALQVVQLDYHGEDLLPKVQSACGGSVTVATLVGCASQSDGPLSGLELPGEGADLVLGVRLAETAGSEVQGSRLAFDVQVSLASQRVQTLDETASEGRVQASDPPPPTRPGPEDLRPAGDGEPALEAPSASPERRPAQALPVEPAPMDLEIRRPGLVPLEEAQGVALGLVEHKLDETAPGLDAVLLSHLFEAELPGPAG